LPQDSRRHDQAVSGVRLTPENDKFGKEGYFPLLSGRIA
jgi:hypothetical protein